MIDVDTITRRVIAAAQEMNGLQPHECRPLEFNRAELILISKGLVLLAAIQAAQEQVR